MIDYLFETTHPGGTFAALIPSAESAEELYAFMVKLDIDNLVEPGDYHCTLIYSSKPCLEIANADFELPCDAVITGFALFGEDKDTLVLEIYCPNATRLNKLFMDKYGATSDFPTYKAHITVASDFVGDIPTDVPEFDVEFSGMEVSELT